MRLGFSLATAKRPDILIVDEALAVGDASFQQKCLKRIQEFSKLGTSILVVSHDLGLVSYFCTRVVLLEKGKLLFDGNPKETIEKYMHVLAGELPVSESYSSNAIQDLRVVLENEKGIQSKVFFIGSQVCLRLSFKTLTSIESATIGFHIDNDKGIRIFGTNTFHLGDTNRIFQNDKEYEVRFEFPIQFTAGKYSLGIAIHKGESHIEGSYFWKESILDFEVETGKIQKFVGICHIPTSFQIKQDWGTR